MYMVESHCSSSGESHVVAMSRESQFVNSGKSLVVIVGESHM
jgi:S-adenosylmethionine/arginine decarboxylase-like enzyme